MKDYVKKMEQEKILFTGGSGLLGKEIKKILPFIFYPTHSEFNVTNYGQIEEYLNFKNIESIIHAAAFISPPKVDKEPVKAIENNIIGTSNLVKLCSKKNIKLTYISTDYVFRGDRGNYKEEDEVFPVNKYAWSKLGGECAVRMYDNSLIIRTSFGPNEYQFEKAFTDQWTSRESAAQIAKRIIKVLERDIRGIIHIGGNRRTVFEYAKSLNPSKEIGKLSIKEMIFNIPRDTSLNCNKYEKLIENKN